jgi:hypothetical protein
MTSFVIFLIDDNVVSLSPLYTFIRVYLLTIRVAYRLPVNFYSGLQSIIASGNYFFID